MPDRMKLALHRSIIFWSGILIMAFIVWGWWASMQADSYLQCGRWTLRNSMAGVSIESEKPERLRFSPSSPQPLFDGSPHEPHQVSFTIERLPPPQWVRGDGQGRPGMNQWFLYANRTQHAWDHRSYLEYTQKFRPAEDWILFLPHWLLLLFTAGMWILLLLWRARRRRHSMISPKEP